MGVGVRFLALHQHRGVDLVGIELREQISQPIVAMDRRQVFAGPAAIVAAELPEMDMGVDHAAPPLPRMRWA